MNVSRQAPRLLQQMVRRYGHDSHFKPATMDELPVPRGSWQAHYEAKQRKHNAVLGFGIVFTVATLVIGKMSGSLYFNWAPPKSLD